MLTAMFCRATKQILQRARQLVDQKKDDGFAALHLAALNDHSDVAQSLVTLVSKLLVYIITTVYTVCQHTPF